MVATILTLHHEKRDRYLLSLMSVCSLDVSKSMSARQKLETQLTENNIVKEVRNSSFSFLKRLIFSPWCHFSFVGSLKSIKYVICLSFQELDLLDSTNTVYKLIGPVLVKQDLDEAKATVTKRLEYINGEM